VYLQLPSALYRVKLGVIELDSLESSRSHKSVMDHESVEFLQDNGILRQTYSLPSIDQFNELVMFCENAFKDVYSIEGDESTLLEFIILNCIQLYITK
jgi:hypothetical protein